MKKTLLVVIDALNSQTLLPELQRFPTLAGLAELGQLRRQSISIFPSLTPAATSTLVTGGYPSRHNILGFHWYDQDNKQDVYYGDDFWVVAKLGFGEFFEECLKKLNGSRLRLPTLFQMAEGRGMRAASLNYLMFHGDQPHQVEVPLWFSWHPSVEAEQSVSGPKILYFGDMVDSDRERDQESPDRKGGLLGRFGFNDDNTARLLLHLADQDELPDFTLAYFPDHDYHCHKHGPEAGLEQIDEVDQALAAFFERLGGLEQALEDLTVVVTGDHSQSKMRDSEAGIALDQMLADFKVAPPGSWPQECRLKVCPDMRTAQLYFREQQVFSEVLNCLLDDPRVDQVLWRDQQGFQVARGDQRLTFRPGDKANDAYGGGWDFEGDLEVVDASVRDGQIQYGDYPNALERIVGGLDNRDGGQMWVTSQPGYEFMTGDTSIHQSGGSHGSLHRLDSTSPLFVAGFGGSLELPEVTRAVDVAPICLRSLGLEPEFAVGAPRFRPTVRA
ncbi:MAG: alkaline phosphatase family protein [Vulcanimicrobiota bacterium]